MDDPQQAMDRAAALVDRGEFAAAEEIGRELLRRLPNSARAMHLLAVVARRTQRVPLAVALLQQAVAIVPDDAGIRCELGLALVDSGRPDDAVAQFRRSVDLLPNYADGCLNLGATLDQIDQPEAALPWSRRAAELQPGNAIAHFNLANIWRALGRLDEAAAEFQTTIRLRPDFANAHWNYACCCLLTGDFARGWDEYQWRARSGEVVIDRYPQPLWAGEPLEGRTILVHAEQGIGDEILFASCFGDLLPRAARCVIVCDPRLETLFARSFPAATVHGIHRRKDQQGVALAERIDVQVPAGDLPLHFRPTAESFPNRRGYLQADPARVADWRRRFDALGPALKIGVSWRAGGHPAERRKRTTTLGPWRELLATPGAHFVNLQYGDSVDELAAARRELGLTIHDWPDADPLVDLDGFAAKIAALDLVISVGNATVHLAGALGVDAWALLPKVPGWRWMIAGARSVWYPQVRLFRQTQRGVWPPVFAHVARLLGEVARLPRPKDAIATIEEKPGARKASIGVERLDRSGAPTIPAAAIPYVAPKLPPVASLVPPRPANVEADWDATFQSAVESFERGQLSEAETQCRRVLDHAPRHLPALNMLGALARQTGRCDLAIRTLQRAVAIAQQDPAVRLNMAAALHEAGKLDDAIEAYRQAIALQPVMVDAHFGLGRALWTAGRRDEAAAALEHVVRLRPDHHKALSQLGGLHLESGRFADAERVFREATRLKPDYMAAHNNLGLALERQQRLREAAACYDRALELDENCAQAVGNLANVMDRLGERSVAALLHQQAATLRTVR